MLAGHCAIEMKFWYKKSQLNGSGLMVLVHWQEGETIVLQSHLRWCGSVAKSRWRCVPARSVQVAFLVFKRRHLHPLLQLLQERSAPLPACPFVRARWHSSADIRVFRADRLQRPSSSMTSEHGFACAVLVHCQLKFLLSPFCFLLLLLLVGLGKLPSQRRSLGGHYCSPLEPKWLRRTSTQFPNQKN